LKTLVLKNIDESLYQRLKNLAQSSSKSLNQTALELLKKSLNVEDDNGTVQIHSDLDHLFGSWNEAEYQEISRKLEKNRKIDDELWN